MRVKKLRPDKIRRGLANPEDFFSEAKQYYDNAKEILKSIEIRHNRYQDAKPVSEACGIGYLSVLLTIDGYLLMRGVDPTNLPTTTPEYWACIKKYLVHNGKIQDAFNTAWEDLHVAGYYRGHSGVEMIKEGFKNAKIIIDTLSKTKPK
jgi:hypothetical protein